MADEPLVVRSPLRLAPHVGRVIAKPFVPGEYTSAAGEAASRAVLARVSALSDPQVKAALATTRTRFAARRPDLDALLELAFARVEDLVDDPGGLSPERRRLIGAYFTHEYSFEAAALTNPSMVAAPDQGGVPAGSLRFVLSLRAIGEGHRSSITFRSGLVDESGVITLDGAGQHPSTGVPGPDGSIGFPPGVDLSERVLFPSRPDERAGMEDARFVRFVEGNGRARYLATYTAFDGAHIRPRLLETDDFASFRVRELEGAAASDKGMALFPRRVGGRFAALSRYDDESNHLVFSDDLKRWDDPVRIQGPARTWELIKLGNCGSPIETEAGWLVVTHGVGPMREYVLGAILLDLDDPSRVIGSLDEPLLAAAEDERDGYVPNVVYSCGSLVHTGRLVVPYGFSDRGTGFATVPLDALLESLSGDPG